MIDQRELKRQLTYDPKTGFFERTLEWSGKHLKGQVGHGGGKGYKVIEIGGRRYRAHRLAWMYVHGVWPEHEIDHINGNRLDNRMENLRDVTRRVNGQNLRTQFRGKTVEAPLGVSWHRVCKRWRAMIWDGSKNIYLGLHDTPELAHAAYLEAKRRLHPGCTI